MLTRLRPAKIHFYLRCMAQRGFTAAQVLGGTGIDPRRLAGRHCLVEIPAYIRIISNIIRLNRAPSLAFALGQALRPGDLGILGYSVMTCRDTDEAVVLWHRYNPIFFGNLIEVRFEQAGRQQLLTYLPYEGIRQDLLQFLIEEKICCDMALQRLIGLDHFPVEHLTLTYPKPAHFDCYAELIRCPIEFCAPRNTMLLSANARSLPLRGHDAETHEHCLALLERIFASVHSGATLAHKVRAILHENLHRPPTIDEVAGRLCCSVRTLNRRLGRENTGFAELAMATRLEAIRNLFATTGLESKEVAARVGFADVRSLRRFFKAHTGRTLRQFRLETLDRAA